MPEAHRYLEWSVRLWDRAADPSRRRRLRPRRAAARAADAASRAGAVVRALTLVDEALASPQVAADPVRAGLLHERRGWYLSRSGRRDEALAAYDLAVQLVPASAAERRPGPGGPGPRPRPRPGRAPRRSAGRGRGRSPWPGGWATWSTRARRCVLGLVLAAEGRTDAAVGALHEAGQIAVGSATWPR